MFNTSALTTPILTLSGQLSGNVIQVTGSFLAVRFFTDSANVTSGWNLTASKYLDGGWSNWSNFSTCAGSCPSTNGTSTRTRTCTNPVPFNGGQSCLGPAIETIVCNIGCNDLPTADANYSIIIRQSDYLNNMSSFWFINATGQSITGFNLQFFGTTEVSQHHVVFIHLRRRTMILSKSLTRLI